MANLKKNELQEKYAKKNKSRRKAGKQTSSKDLPPGMYRKTGKAIEKRRKLLQSI
jgi:hypothetical protein